MRDIVKMIVVLTVIATVMGTTLGLVESITQEPIEYSKLKFVKGPAILDVLSGYDNDPIKEYVKELTLEGEGGEKIVKSIFPAKKNGKTFAVAFEVMGRGYGGDISIMIGVELETGKLLGMRVMTHSETPGLGALSVEPDFYNQFSELNPDEVALSDKGGKINAISGATITSNGVIAAVQKGLELFSRAKDQIAAAVKTA